MILAGPRALPCYVRVLAWPDHHMPAAARLRFSRLQAMPHQGMKCIIQAAAMGCPAATVAAMTAAAVTQPAAVTAATATSSGAAAGLTSQDASCPGGGAGT